MEEQIHAVQRMQDYIEEHLYENIAPADLADASLYSPWYSYRLFIQWLHMTPADYIRKLRLSKSALKLRDEDIKIIDAALESGYKSVDGFQRAFFREFGCNPKEYAVHPVPIYLFHPYGIKYSAIEKERIMENVKNVFIQVIDKPKRKVIIKRGIQADNYWTYCQEVGCDVWGLLLSIKTISLEPVCLWLPKSYIKPGTSEYVQGAEVSADYDGPIPDGFDIIDLPASKYLMFQGEPFNEEDYCQAIEQVQDSISKYEPSAIGYSWDPSRPRIQLEPIGERGYIELVGIK